MKKKGNFKETANFFHLFDTFVQYDDSSFPKLTDFLPAVGSVAALTSLI